MNVCNIKKLSLWGVRIVLVLIILFWMSTIFGFSAETGTQSQGLSDKITIRAVQIIEPEYSSLDLTSKEELFNMDFSLFKTITQRVSVLNNNPPAMRVETICYTKKSPIRYNIVVQATIVRKDGDFNG